MLAGLVGLSSCAGTVQHSACFMLQWLWPLSVEAMGFRGRIWAQFLSLFFEAIFLFCFGLVDNSQPWYVALAVLICFSLFVQMAEGTSYGIVPFMNRTHGMAAS